MSFQNKSNMNLEKKNGINRSTMDKTIFCVLSLGAGYLYNGVAVEWGKRTSRNTRLTKKKLIVFTPISFSDLLALLLWCCYIVCLQCLVYRSPTKEEHCSHTKTDYVDTVTVPS